MIVEMRQKKSERRHFIKSEKARRVRELGRVNRRGRTYEEKKKGRGREGERERERVREIVSV